VGTLFEKLKGREAELRKSLKRAFAGLRSGEVKLARQHHPNDTTACLPLIDDWVVVIQPADHFSIVSRMSADSLIDIASTETIDLLIVEREPG
jgi:hypothetical protein